jgi:hypothetical protein
MYMLANEGNKDFIANMQAGIYRHVSIGFAASDLVPVKGKYDETLFWEYKGPGEATEGSLVWLGAQPGATAQKNYKATQGAKTMNVFLQKIGTAIGKAFGEDVKEDEVLEAVIFAIKAKDSALSQKDHQIAELTDQLSESKAMADLGQEYVKGLVGDYVRMKAALGECDESEEVQKKMKSFARSMGVEFLKSETAHLEKRMAEKFPDSQLKGDMRKDKSRGKQAEDGNDNPLIPEDQV